ncbi:endonuclease [Achromobacter phage 2-1]|nr:endonuclease [Achromobacter phage 2-1]
MAYDHDELAKLVKRIMKRITNYGKPGECWPWTGKKSQPRTRVRRGFTLGSPITIWTQKDKPYPSTRHKGKYVNPVRMVYEYLKPEVATLERPWKLSNNCGDSLCCNPEHWDVHIVGMPKPEKKKKSSEPMPEFPPDPEDMMANDCMDLLDQIFSTGGPATLQELLTHAYMVDFPKELIIKQLHAMGKGHIVNAS